MHYVYDFFAVIGGLYTVVSVIGNVSPKGKFRDFCVKVALVLKKIEDEKPADNH
jgi:hypothetical protein